MNLYPLAAALLLAVPTSAFAEGDVPAVGGAVVAPVLTAAPRGPGLNFTMTPAQMRQDYEEAIRALEREIDAIVAIPAAERTFNNTILALEHATTRVGERLRPASLMTAVSPDAAVRAAADALDTEQNEYFTRFGYREDIYRAVREYAAKGETLAGESQRLLEKWLRDYRKSGMDLPPERREHLQRLQIRLSDLSQRFANNIRDHQGGLDFTPDELRAMNLPDGYISRLRPSPTDATKLRAGATETDYFEFMRRSTDAEARRRLQFEYHNRAAAANVPILEEMLSVRTEIAQTLGYSNSAEMTVDGRMAGTVQRVTEFLTGLRDRLLPRAQAETQELLDLKRQDDPNATELHFWDQAYYVDRLRRLRFSLDPDEVRKYFPVDVVVQGTLGVYQDLLGLKFTEIAGNHAWHADVKLYQVEDKASGRLIGYFFMDLYPRPGKASSGAFAATIVQGRELEDGRYQAPVSAMVANLTPPSPTEPSLLAFGDVNTFFHEFGHIMHQVLTQARYPTFSGSSVALDFVEAPSQMLEEFLTKPEVLDRISGHYQDPSRKMPADMRQRLIDVQNFRKASDTIAQVGLAMMDLAYNVSGGQVDTTAIMRRVFGSIGLPPFQQGTHFHASFGHLASHYASGYYGYLWSKVYALDMFSRFEREGVMNPRTGAEYRRIILSRGSTQDAQELLREFLGREPNMDAFLRSIGAQPGPSLQQVPPSRN